MAAYAALVSLFNTLDQIQNHPRFSNSLDKYQIESLGTHINFLLDFVESYNIDGDLSKVVEELRRQIVCAAHEAEDIVESYIVNQILPESADISDARLHHRCLFGLQKVIQHMDSIKDKVVKIKEETGFNFQKLPNSTPAASSMPRPLSSEQNMMVGFEDECEQNMMVGFEDECEQNMMVGFEDELMQLKDVLIGQQSSRQIVSIVGMGGSGKTTLAKHVYEDSLTLRHFDLRAWATISQQYDVRDILLQLLSVAEGTLDELGERLHKKLFGRRYLIVLDDMWDMEVWNRLKFFFPDNGDGSRIILTTRLSNIATQLCSICIEINFLDEDKSWNLFCQKIFGHKYCPVELEGIGKKIVEQCKGLPLSIVVIGGVLRKSPETKEYWQNVAQNMNAIFNSTENGQCLDVLYLSYSHLPAHLKPCFLYLGTFREDSQIRVSEIIRLWVAEGFLKPNGVQILEEVAEDCLKDLIDRNLILVCGHRLNGRIKSFRIHDLLRELCLKVADKEKFFYVIREDSTIPQDIDRERRLVFHDQTLINFRSTALEDYFQSASSLARSLICNKAVAACRLLRVLIRPFRLGGAEFQNVNLRYVDCFLSKVPSSMSLVWNLQTLVIDGSPTVAPLDFWKMTQLRHLKSDCISLPDPPPSDEEDNSFVLGNLQTLTLVKHFRLSEEVCKRIPNVKKFGLMYGRDHKLDYELKNLGRFQRLESLEILSDSVIWISKLKNTFPSSIKKLSLKLSLNGVVLACSEDFSTIFGSLPQLEVLKLSGECSFRHQKWSCVEGGFLRLKYLSIGYLSLKSWTLDGASCFPVLEKLVLVSFYYLDEIPSGIGEIPTLQLIRLENCKESLVISAMKMKEKQESFGNYGLRIQVKTFSYDREKLMKRVKAEGLSIKNIQLH